jgi:hypothetical protein
MPRRALPPQPSARKAPRRLGRGPAGGSASGPSRGSNGGGARVSTPAPATPYWLLWSSGIAAAVLAIVAFLLWGIIGGSTLFDMIVALCM